MAPTLTASFLVVSAAADTSTLTTPSFTPAAGDIIVVKTVSEDTSQTVGLPSDTQTNVYTSRVASATNVQAKICTATAGSATSMTVSVTFTVTSRFHSMIVEQWSGASLAVTPATNGTKTGTGAPASTITTTANGSVVSWCNGDFAAVSPAGRTYDTSSATPVEDGLHDVSPGSYVAYYLHQPAATAGSQNLGITAPGGQTWTLLGIEILASTGPLVDPNQANSWRPWRAWYRQRAMFLSTYDLFTARDVASVLTPDSLPVLIAGPVPVRLIPAPQPFLAGSRDVTALQASASPPVMLGPPSGRSVFGAPAALLFRSTADPVSVDSLPHLLIAAAPLVAGLAPAMVLAASRVEVVTLVPPTIAGTTPAVPARPAPVPLVLRSTADPQTTSDTPTVVLASRIIAAAPAVAAATVLASRDVTPLQPSSNPATPVLGRAPWSTTAPAAILSRSTADPSTTDSPTDLVTAPAGAIPYAAPAPVLAGSRDVTALQASASPPAVIVGRIPWVIAAPRSLLIRPAADPPDIPPVARLVSAPAVRLPDLVRVLSLYSMPPPPAERRTDGALILTAPRLPVAARAWLLTPRREPVVGLTPKAPFLAPGTRTGPAGIPGARTGAAVLPGTRTAAQIEGGA